VVGEHGWENGPMDFHEQTQQNVVAAAQFPAEKPC
jgi:hypothetical protein